MTRFFSLASLLCALLALPTTAEADDLLNLGGRIQSDVRFRPSALHDGPWYAPADLPRGLSWNQNLVKLRAVAEMGRVSALADVDFLWTGWRVVETLDDLTARERVDPYRLKSHAAYVQVRDMFVAGLDLRVGQQLVNWGKGDQFNPTNTLNASDLEDPLLFGHQLANTMVRADYAPEGTWSLSGVLVPVFKPAVLPRTARLALSDLRRIPVDQDALRRRLLVEQAMAERLGYPTVVSTTRVELPDMSFDNMQAALRLAWTTHEQDIALSYYYGRSDIPQPFRNDTSQQNGPRCNPADPTACLAGSLQTAVSLHYPRMQVIGINLAGELPILALFNADLAPFGYHVELGVFLPQQASLRLFNGPLLGARPEGEYPYGLGGGLPQVLSDRAFAKWNVGIDYTLFERYYINAQWVHGFVDEFGAGDFLRSGVTSVRGTVGGNLKEDSVVELLRPRLGDYLVLGVDTHFLADQLLARLFVIADLSGMREAFFDSAAGAWVSRRLSPFATAASAVLFPELTYNAGNGLELSVGAIAKLGRLTSKFGDPAAGGTDIWTRARYSF